MGQNEIILALVGIVAGFLNVMAGGGSMLTVPVMIFLGIPGPIANGTNRIAIVAQCVSSVGAFFRKGYSDFGLSLSLAVAAIPGAVVGAMVATKMNPVSFNKVLAVIMIIVMISMWLGEKGNSRIGPASKPPTRTRLITGHLLMALAGLWGGFIQIGIGFILIPILHRVIGLDLVRTNMHKVFIVLIYTLLALGVFASQIRLAWLSGIALAVGMAAGGWIGAHIQVKHGSGIIKVVLNLVLVAFITKLLFFPGH